MLHKKSEFNYKTVPQLKVGLKSELRKYACPLMFFKPCSKAEAASLLKFNQHFVLIFYGNGILMFKNAYI